MSSNKHALVVTSSDEFDHQEMLSNSGPTPSAPASGANLHVPSSAEGAGGASFTSLNDQCPPSATSISNSKVSPSAESDAIYVTDSGASAGFANSPPLMALAKPK